MRIRRCHLAFGIIALLVGCGSDGGGSTASTGVASTIEVSTVAPTTTPTTTSTATTAATTVTTTPVTTLAAFPTTTLLSAADYASPRDSTADTLAALPGGLQGADLDLLARRLADALEAQGNAAAPNTDVAVSATVTAVVPGERSVVVVSLRGGEGDDTSDGHEVLATFERSAGTWTLVSSVNRTHCTRGVAVDDPNLCV